nr:MAG: hypothetical protein [Microvirus sp.]
MSKRHKIGSGASKRMFTKSASFVHPKNAINSTVPMRGGIRF